MKRIIPALCFTLFFTCRLTAGDTVAPIDGFTPEKLLGGADNLKVVTTSKDVTVYLLAKEGSAKDEKSVTIDGWQCSASATVPGADAGKVTSTLADAANFGVDGSTFKVLANPAIIIRFKTDAGSVDLVIDFKSSEMVVYRDGKLAPRTFNKKDDGKNSFRKSATVALEALAKNAFPEDAGIKALPPPVMSTADLITALKAAGAAYYDHYHAIPATPENYVVIMALTGKTRDKQSFIDLNPGQISPNGEILDEWGTPLRFLFSQDLSDPPKVWSAGKDKIFGTADDIEKPKPEDMPGAEGQ